MKTLLNIATLLIMGILLLVIPESRIIIAWINIGLAIALIILLTISGALKN